MITYAFVGLVVIALCLAVMVVWSRKSLLPRWTAVLMALVVMVTAYPIFQDILSRPKSVEAEWLRRETPEAILLKHHVDYGVALYLWYLLPGETEPRYYVMEWSDETKKMAQQAQEARKRAGKRKVVVSKPFENSLNKERVIHPLPQPKEPDKKATGKARRF